MIFKITYYMGLHNNTLTFFFFAKNESFLEVKYIQTYLTSFGEKYSLQ
jgi:hypothetical protein